MLEVKLEGEVGEDRRIELEVPEAFRGKHVTITVVAEETPKRGMTGKELAESEFVGMWKERDDLPTTNEEFREWRRKLWDRSVRWSS